jgi:hypothetical protein
MDEKTVARFWAKVNRNGRTVRPELGPCWEWTAHRSADGYGSFGLSHRKTVVAHRISYELATGEPPGEFMVCHHCDNRACVNPAHLFLGTGRDNMRDAVAKGRVCSGHRSHFSRNHPDFVKPSFPGERHGMHKLTEADVLTIRFLVSCGAPRRHVGEWFGVCEASIDQIVWGKTWKHVPMIRCGSSGDG